MFFNSKSISDLALMLDELSPRIPVIVKGYTKINSLIVNPSRPDAVFAFCGPKADMDWVVWDFDPAQPAGTDDIDGFFDGCEVFGIETNVTFDGVMVNAIIVYRDLWG